MADRTKHWNKLYDAKPKKGSGHQRHFRGKMVLPNGSPRASSHGGNSPSDAGYTAWDTPADQTKHTPGRYKVPEPTKFWHRSGIVRNARTGLSV